MKRRTQHFDGFTLVELAAVAALFALLASATFVTYAQTWRHWVVRQNAQQFYLAARYARVLAIESGQACQLVVDRENGIFYIAQDSGENDQAMIVSSIWNRPTQLAEGVAFERMMIGGDTEGQAMIAFRPDGRADAAMVQLGNGQRHYTVQISAATARATLLSGVVDDYQPDQIDLNGVYQ